MVFTSEPDNLTIHLLPARPMTLQAFPVVESMAEPPTRSSAAGESFGAEEAKANAAAAGARRDRATVKASTAPARYNASNAFRPSVSAAAAKSRPTRSISRPMRR